jgi:rhodanese-related sulfurtransferase
VVAPAPATPSAWQEAWPATGQPTAVLGACQAPTKGILPGAPVAFTPKPKPGELTVEEFRQLVAAPHPCILILDVRNQDELADGVFPGSVNIPVAQLPARLAELPRDERIVIHCSAGHRAETAYQVLKQAGFADVAFLNAKVDFFGGMAEIGGE